MRTCLLFPALFSTDGGIERILRLYLRATGELAGANGRVHLVVLNDGPILPERLVPYATPALAPPVVCGRRRLACVWQTIRLARRSDRLICGHMNLLRLAHLARRFSARLEVWLVAHGIEVWRSFNGAERRALLATRRILCVSDYTRARLAANCPGLAAQQLVVQPNALDPQFTIAPSPAGATQAGLILSVARLDAAEQYKGIDHMIAALPAIAAAVPGARLRIVGDGNDRPRLEELARAGGQRDLVEFTGRVSDAVLRDHFAACQLFALPSNGEGFGLVYLEAFAQGKPCLGARAGGVPEVISDDTGVLVDYGDVPGLASAIGAALRRSWDNTRMLARAKDFSYPPFKARLCHLLNA